MVVHAYGGYIFFELLYERRHEVIELYKWVAWRERLLSSAHYAPIPVLMQVCLHFPMNNIHSLCSPMGLAVPLPGL